ncbi:TPA: zonular occludens toxin domain-containing protein, partial [Pseudomonas aeruginosa]
RDDIRMTAEKAYLHSNLAVIGIRGRYKESQHSAQDNKPPARDVIVEIKKIRQETFALYESTATGSVTDTIAGKSLFRQPKILLFMAIPALAIGSVVYDGGPRLL